MKKLLILPVIFLSFCTSPTIKTEVANSADPLQKNIEDYVKSKTNNPTFYKSLETTPKAIVIDTAIIKNCYQAKYIPVVVDFKDDSKKRAPLPMAVDIKEKFFKLLHSFEQQSSTGAIIKSQVLIYVDDSSKVVDAHMF
jgi:hypothetical protein